MVLKDLGELCKKKNLTLSELAARCGVSVGYLSLLSRGKRQNVSIEILQKICAALDITTSELLGENPGHNAPKNSIQAVLDYWRVSSGHQAEFTAYMEQLSGYQKGVFEAVWEGFLNHLRQQAAISACPPARRVLLIILALAQGTLAGDFAARLGLADVAGEDSMVAKTDRQLILKANAQLILQALRAEIPAALEFLERSAVPDMGAAAGYWHLGELCYRNGLYEQATKYLAMAILHAYWRQDMAVFHQAFELIRVLPESQLRSLVLTWRTTITMAQQGQYPEVIEIILPALAVPGANQAEKQYKSRLASTLGAVYLTLGRYREALRALRESILLWPDSPLSGVTYVNIGTVLRRVGRFQQASAAYQRAMKFQQPVVAIPALAGLAQVCLDQAEFEAARKHLLHGYWLAKKTEGNIGKGEILVNLGVYYKQTERRTKARRLLELGLKHALQAGERRAMLYANLELADLLIAEHRVQEADQLLNKFFQAAALHEEVLILGYWANLKAQLYLHLDQPGHAVLFLKLAYRELAATNSPGHELDKCLRLLEQTCRRLKEPHEADFYKNERLKMRRSRLKKIQTGNAGSRA